MTRHSEHAGRRPLYVLVGSYGFGARGLPSFGPIPATVGDVGIVGLPFGRGDPASAHLERRQWAVVQIDDADDVREVCSPSGALAAVEFHKGAVLFNGSPRGALERLLLLGASPNEMSAQLVLQDATGRAEGGAYSVAIAGEFGDTIEHAAPDRVFGDGGEEALDQIEPRRARRREGHPSNLRFAAGVLWLRSCRRREVSGGKLLSPP